MNEETTTGPRETMSAITFATVYGDEHEDLFTFDGDEDRLLDVILKDRVRMDESTDSLIVKFEQWLVQPTVNYLDRIVAYRRHGVDKMEFMNKEILKYAYEIHRFEHMDGKFYRFIDKMLVEIPDEEIELLI